jgi:hypothetical protein
LLAVSSDGLSARLGSNSQAERLTEQAGLKGMVWFFTRGDEELQLQTERDAATGEYSLTWRNPDGSSQTERFTDSQAFRRRLEQVEARLANEAWTRQDPPMLLSDAWRV